MRRFDTPALLPAPVPNESGAHLLLLAIRRTITHGPRDHGIERKFEASFGRAYRRPLVLVRVLVNEILAAACTSVAVAPCCCPRMTSAEAAILAATIRINTAPDAARLLIADLLANRRPERVLASLAAVVEGFADAGRPIGGWR
ncbi:MAG: hypothetical protein H2054_07795 [Sphingomonas sp.]|uniref:hypothetical protein n=1 Tax=Sphingomonas sp. TaxID=28214 RepID=UPI0017DFA77B|nr:hypothetical protein [Sphingomonas sp.]